MSTVELHPIVTTQKPEPNEASASRIELEAFGFKPRGQARIDRDRFLGSLGVGSLRVIAPIEFRVIRVDGQFVAEAPGFDEFGQGDNRSDAIADLQHSIAQLFESLGADESRLGADLASVLADLRRHIVRA